MSDLSLPHCARCGQVQYACDCPSYCLAGEDCDGDGLRDRALLKREPVDPAGLAGQYFLQVWDGEVYRQGQILIVDHEGIKAELLWWEPNRASTPMIFTPECLEQLVLFGTFEEMRAGYERYHPGEIAAWSATADRGTVH
jgi:hypothetical protein